MPAEGKQFDLGKIPPAIRKAGFDAPEVQLSVRGRIEESGGQLLLRVPRLQEAFRLLGEVQLQALRRERGKWNQSVLINGVQLEGEAEGFSIDIKGFQFPR